MPSSYTARLLILSGLALHMANPFRAQLFGQPAVQELVSYKVGDNLRWAEPDFDDSSWMQFSAGEFPDAISKGVSWFRYVLEVSPSTLPTTLGLSLTLRGAAEIYLDGELLLQTGRIGSVGEEEIIGANWNLQSLTLSRSSNHDRLSRHILAIRYSNLSYDGPQWSGFQPRFDLAVGALADLSRAREHLVGKVTTNQMALTSVCLAFALLHLLLFVFYKRLRANLFYAVITVLAAVNIYFEFQPIFVEHPSVLLLGQRLDQISFTLFALACLRFMYLIKYAQRPRIFVLFAVTGFTLCIWTWMRPFFVQQYLFLYMLATIAEIGRTFLAGRKDEKLFDGAWIIGVGALLLIAGALYDILGSFGIIPVLWTFIDFPTPYYGMLGFMIGMSIFLARHFGMTNRSLEARLEEVRELSEQNLRQQVERARLEAENERKSHELEEARKLQLSMLPKVLPNPSNLEIAVYMRTATEVGGDYYDFRMHEDGTLTAAIGDATGHGLQAGTMVSATKSLFNALADEPEPARILKNSTKALKQMGLKQMFMGLTIAKFRNYQMQVAAAGMPFTLIYRVSTKRVEEVVLKGMPLGSFPDFVYQQEVLDLEPGDTVLFMSDGFPELFNQHNEELGEERAQELFLEIAAESPDQIIAHLVKAGEAWANGRAQEDDVTFIAIRLK